MPEGTLEAPVKTLPTTPEVPQFEHHKKAEEDLLAGTSAAVAEHTGDELVDVAHPRAQDPQITIPDEDPQAEPPLTIQQGFMGNIRTKITDTVDYLRRGMVRRAPGAGYTAAGGVRAVNEVREQRDANGSGIQVDQNQK